MLHPTDPAIKRFFAGVGPGVEFERGQVDEALGTRLALKVFYARVDAQMDLFVFVCMCQEMFQ